MSSAISNSGYYTLLIIPIGITFCILIKFGSDLSLINKGFTIDLYETFTYDEPYQHLNQLLGLIQITQKSNDENYMIIGIPTKVEEILSKSNELGIKEKYFLNIWSLTDFIPYAEIGNVLDGIICTSYSKSQKLNLISRIAYDRAINLGHFILKDRQIIINFLDKNRILPSNSINSDSLKKLPSGKILTLFNLGYFDRSILSSRNLLFAKWNSASLILSLISQIEVFNC